MSKGASSTPRVGQPIATIGNGLALMNFWLQQRLLSLGRNPNNAVESMMLGPSPFLFTNTTGFDMDIVISGASNVDFSRNDMPMMSIGADGIFRLNPGDSLEIMYTSTPTVTIIPR